MNLDTINTVDELLNQNQVEPTVDEIVDNILSEDEEEKTPVDTVCDIVFNEHPNVGYDTLERIVDGLIHLHQEVLTDKIEEKDVDSVVFWSKDLQNLRTIRNLLNDITR